MNLQFNLRKWWHFSSNRSIGIEIAGINSNPSIYIRADGDEGRLSFHIGCFIGIWLSLEGFLPLSWYPRRKSEKYGWLGDERELSVSIHGGSLWWNFWVSEEKSSYSRYKTWRKGCFHFFDHLRGKHECQRTEVERRQFLLPFLEGNYNVEVIKYNRLDTYSHWFKHKMIQWEVRTGYYDHNNTFVEKGIPMEGKGENSWDCDEDATYAMSFPGPPYNKKVLSCYDAALYFLTSMLRDRERRGGANWRPKENTGLKIIM